MDICLQTIPRSPFPLPQFHRKERLDGRPCQFEIPEVSPTHEIQVRWSRSTLPGQIDVVDCQVRRDVWRQKQSHSFEVQVHDKPETALVHCRLQTQ